MIDSTVILFGLCIFGFFFLMLMALVSPAPKTVSVADRVKKVSRSGALRDEEKLQQSFFERVLIPFSDQVARIFGSYTPETLTRDSSKVLAEAGLTNYLSGSQIAGFSWLLALLLPTIFGAVYIPSNTSWHMKFMVPMLAMMVGFRLPLILVRVRARKRKDQIIKSLPFAFDLLGISVEAGMGFDGAMAAVAERSKGPLVEELSRTLTEVRLGKPRRQALTDLGDRTGVEDLKSFVSAVSFISDLGGSLTDVLRVQAEAMRVKRRQRAEEKAMKAPVKMMLPLVFFIFPSLFIVMLGPAMIMIAENLFTQ